MDLIQQTFDGSAIRVVADDDGSLFFVAKDVAEALGYTWSRAGTIGHVPDEWKGSRTVQLPQGSQVVSVLSEQGLYFFLGRSDKPKALPLQKWLAGDVLPSLRKTGSYSLTTSTAPKQLAPRAVAYEYVENLLLRAGVHRGIASARMLDIVESDTGIPLDAARKALPAVTEDLGGMNATQLAERVGTTAVKINKQLEALGLQEKSGKEWTLTAAGKQHADAFPYTRNGHSSTQIKWRESVLDVLPCLAVAS